MRLFLEKRRVSCNHGGSDAVRYLLKSMIGLMPPKRVVFKFWRKFGIEIRKKDEILKRASFAQGGACGVQCRFLKMLHYHWSYSVT